MRGLVGRGFQEALLITSTALSGPQTLHPEVQLTLTASLQHRRDAALTPASVRIGLGTGTVWGQLCADGGDAEEQKQEEEQGSRVDLTFLANVHFLEFKFPKSPAQKKKNFRKLTFDKVPVALHTEGV